MASPMNPPDSAGEFLASCGWPGARIEPLAGDASFRRYFRVIDDGRQAVLMDAPPPHEDPRPFIAVAEWLVEHGLRAPQILARDLDRGLLLIDDFGDARLFDIEANGVEGLAELDGQRQSHVAETNHAKLAFAQTELRHNRLEVPKKGRKDATEIASK